MSASTPRSRDGDHTRSQQYQVIRVVGEGAYGMVLKCRNRATGDIVAIKKFRGNYDDPNLRRGMQREVKVLKLLKRHPNIIRMYEAFKRKGRLHVAFEFFPRNLLDVLQQNTGGLKLSLVKHYICQLAAALKYCHSLNIIHRDIKPENILIDDEHRLKLCDFGFARTISPDDDNMTDYVATRWYRPPELVLGFKQYDGSVDVWAMACILGELLDGQPLFPGENDVDQLHIIQSCCGRMTREQLRRFFTDKRFAEIRVLPGTNPNSTLAGRYGELLPPAGVAFMEKCLKMDPAERPTAAGCYDDTFFDDVREELIAADEEFYRNLKEAEQQRTVPETPRTPVTPRTPADGHSVSSLTTPMRRLSLTSNPPTPSPTPPLSPVLRQPGESERPDRPERRASVRRGSDASECAGQLTTPTTDRSQRGRSPQITNPATGRGRTKGGPDLSPKQKAGVKPVSVPVTVPAKNQRDGTPQKQRPPKMSPSKLKRSTVAMLPPVGLPSYKHKPQDAEAMPATPTTPTPPDRRNNNNPQLRNMAENRTPQKKSNKPESIQDIVPLPAALGMSLALAAARRASRTSSISDAAAAFQLPVELLVAEPKGAPRASASDDAAPQDVRREAAAAAPAIMLQDAEATDKTAGANLPKQRRRSTYLAEGKPATPRVRSSHRPTRLSVVQLKMHRHKSDDLLSSIRARAAAAHDDPSPPATFSGDWDLLDDEAFETEDDVFERFHRHSNSFSSQNGSLPSWQEISPTAALLRTRFGLAQPPHAKPTQQTAQQSHHKSRASVGNFQDFQSFFGGTSLTALLAENTDTDDMPPITSHVPKLPAKQQEPPIKSPERGPRRANAASDGLRNQQPFLSPQPMPGVRPPRPQIQRVKSMPRHGLRPKQEDSSPQRPRPRAEDSSPQRQRPRAEDSSPQRPRPRAEDSSPQRQRPAGTKPLPAVPTHNPRA